MHTSRKAAGVTTGVAQGDCCAYNCIHSAA